MTNEQQTCPKCGQPLKQSGSGSITQWMFACTCSLVVERDDRDDELDLCMKCGKRIGAGRDGSFTQFIFRTSLCACAQPTPLKASQSISQQNKAAQRERLMSNASRYFDESDESEELELELDANTFPLERYKPLAELGRGVFGSVHLCRDRLLNKLVAVKSLHKLSTEQLMSFQREAKAHSMLTHPNIIRVLDFGATEYGCPFMVMEFVNSISLEEFLINNGPLSERLASRTVAQICEALRYVHEKQIFHRDIKPSNILLTPDPESSDLWNVHLIDFGVAGIKHHQESTIVQGKTLVGTPTYMSPDQLLNRPYDARSEVYSVGCLLFELLTGTPPFTDDSPLVLAKRHASEAPPAMADVCDREFSDAIERIAVKALSKEPADRYQSTAAMRADLLAAAERADVAARAAMTDEDEEIPLMLEPETKPAERSWKVAALVAAALFCVIISGAAISMWSAIPGEKQRNANANKNEKLPKNEILYDITNDVEENGTFTVENGIHVLKGRWSEAQLRKLARTEKKIKGLHILHSTLDWKGLKAFKNSGVTELTIEETDFDLSNARYLAYLQDLGRFQANEKDFRGPGMEALAPLAKLEILVIDDGQIDAQGWKAIGDIKSLRRIAAYGTTGWSGKDIKPITYLPLTSLDISNTKIGDTGVEEISRVKPLQSLELNNCQLTDVALEYIGGLKGMQNLYLNSNPVTDRGLMHLKELTGLKTLKIYDSGVTQAAVDDLRKSLPYLSKDVLKKPGFGIDLEKLTDQEKIPIHRRF